MESGVCTYMGRAQKRKGKREESGTVCVMGGDLMGIARTITDRKR